MASSGAEFSIGVEEEYQIVDARTLELRQRAARLMPHARRAAGDDVTNELYLSQIEIGTPVCTTLADVRTELTRLRGAVIEAARREGCRIAAAGTHPFSHWSDQTLTPKPRYQELVDDFPQLTREQIIFGCHVHIGITDREVAIQVMNRARPWLPAILALSANSPFWLGHDTGYASYRTELFQRFPMSGTPHVFASRTEYDALVSALVDTGIIVDASNIYWDIRPSSHVETLEFRVADVCMTVDETVMIAGLLRALTRACQADWLKGTPVDPVRPELLRAAKWRASRFGLEGDLIDPRTHKPVPASAVIEGLLAFLRPWLEEAGEWDELSGLTRATLARGSGAKRQRDALARSGRREDVVDLIIAETEQGIGIS